MTLNRVKIFLTGVVFGMLVLVLSGCSQTNDYKDYEHEKISAVNKHIKIIKKIKTKYEYPTLLDMHISGEIEGHAKIRISHYPYENFIEIKLNGKIDESYSTDWYDNEILIEYIPIGDVKGEHITIKYKLK